MDPITSSLTTLWLADLFMLGGGAALPANENPQVHLAFRQEHWREEITRYNSQAVLRTGANSPVVIEHLELNLPWATVRSRPALGSPLEAAIIGPLDLVVLDDGSSGHKHRVWVPLQISPLGITLDEDNQLQLTEIVGAGIGGELWTTLPTGSVVSLRASGTARTQRIHQPDDEPADWAHELAVRGSVGRISKNARNSSLRLWADATWRFEPRDDLGGRDGVDGRSFFTGVSYLLGVRSDWTEQLHPLVLDSFTVKKTDCGTITGKVRASGRRTEVQLLVNKELVQTFTMQGDQTETFEVPWPAFTPSASSVVELEVVAGARSLRRTVSLAPETFPPSVTVTEDLSREVTHGIILRDPHAEKPIEATLSLFPECVDRSGLAVDVTLGDDKATTHLDAPAYGSKVTLTPTTDDFLVTAEVEWSWHGWPAGSDSSMVKIGAPCVDTDGDGFTQCDGDCDNKNALINPGATDVPGDGVDNNCDGINGQDLDGDSFEDVSVGGKDCNDADPQINPKATEVPYNGVDEDCDPRTRDDDLDNDGFVKAEDCDDDDRSIFPGAEEVWDCVDQDCDGVVDNGVTIGDDPHAPVTSPRDGLLYDTWTEERFTQREYIVGQPGKDDWFVFSTLEHDPWVLDVSVEPVSPKHGWEVELVRLSSGIHTEPLPKEEWYADGSWLSYGTYSTLERPKGLHLYDGTRSPNILHRAATATLRVVTLGLGSKLADEMDERERQRAANAYDGNNAGVYAVRARPLDVEAQSCPATLSIRHD